MSINKFLSAVTLLLISLVVSLPLSAAQVDGLYSAQVKTVGQGPAQRAGGFQQALRVVVGKLSGDQQLANSQALRGLIRNAAKMVQQYRYEPIPAAERALKRNGKRTHYLAVQFVPSILNRELNALQVPIWGDDRPLTLVWLGLEYDRDRQILSTNNNQGIQDLLMTLAHDRGLPVLLPLMDMEDQAVLDFSDIRGGFSDRISAASQRYRTYAVLSASVRQGRNGGWVGDWLLDTGGENKSWSSSGSLEQVIETGLNGLGGDLAARFATGQSVAAKGLNLEVRNLGGLNAYVRLNDYLNGLSMVESADLTRLTSDLAQFQLQVKGNLSDLQRTIALGRVLTPFQESGLVVDDGTPVDLRYNLSLR